LSLSRACSTKMGHRQPGVPQPLAAAYRAPERVIRRRHLSAMAAIGRAIDSKRKLLGSGTGLTVSVSKMRIPVSKPKAAHELELAPVKLLKILMVSMVMPRRLSRLGHSVASYPAKV